MGHGRGVLDRLINPREMSDIKDILGVSRGGAGGEQGPKGPKPKKEKMKRPTGLSREAFALLGDSHPIMSSQLLEGLNKGKKDADKLAKPKPSTKGIPTWHNKPFKNSARTDGLELLRWSKSFKDGLGRVRETEDAEYYYAKFNKKVCQYAALHCLHATSHAWPWRSACTCMSCAAPHACHYLSNHEA